MSVMEKRAGKILCIIGRNGSWIWINFVALVKGENNELIIEN